MHVDEQDHRRHLRTVIEEVIADPDMHAGLSFYIWLLLDSRGVDVPMAYNPTFVMLSPP
jgi:hypothetical protein